VLVHELYRQFLSNATWLNLKAWDRRRIITHEAFSELQLSHCPGVSIILACMVKSAYEPSGPSSWILFRSL